MDVVVVFQFSDITDPDSEEATAAVDSLTIDLTNAGVDCDSWHIDDALGGAVVAQIVKDLPQALASKDDKYTRLRAACVEAINWAQAQDEDNCPDWVDRMAIVMDACDPDRDRGQQTTGA